MSDERAAPIQAIVDNDLCIACGACIPTCPKRVVTPAYSHYRGAQEVRITEPKACELCSGPCGDVCPSIRAFPDRHHRTPRLGPITQVYTAHSRAFQHDGTSSSGGIIRELCHQFLSRGTGVISLLEEPGEGRSRYEAGLLRRVDELEKMPGSIYHSVSFHEAIPILRESEKPLVLVAIPCHLEGISKYIESQQPDLAEKIALRVGIICGWMYSDHALANFADAHAIREPVLDAKYRGEDKVGKLKIRTATQFMRFDRRRFQSTREMIAYRSSFSTDVNRLRCRLCQNHTNVQSDISVGDAWLARKSSQKLSLVVTRTRAGETAFDELKRSGRIEVEPGSVADIEESQSKNLVYGTVARRLSRHRARRNLPVVEYAFQESGSDPRGVVGARFWLERVKRGLIRKRRYRAYRTVYALSKPQHLLAFLVKRVF